jgi:hypothetical protein
LKQYQQVLLECYKLEQINPGNKMANYYKTRAESRLKEMGLPIPTPAEITPVVTPQITPVAPIPTLAAPVQTQVSELPKFPDMTTPIQTPVARATSPLAPAETLTETPIPEETTVGETKPPSVVPRDQTDISPVGTPAPIADTGLSPIEKFKKYQESNSPLFLGIMTAALIFAALIILAVILLIRKFSMKRRIAKLEKLTAKAQEKMAEPVPVKQDLRAVKPAAPPESPGFDFQIPDFPTPESFDNQFTPPPMPETETPDFLQPTIPEITEPADIPSPYTFDQIVPQLESEPGLPDIPSPTAPPLLKTQTSEDQELEIPGLPPDLPTFQGTPNATPFPAPSDEDMELPAFSFDEKTPDADAPPLEAPPQEQPLSFDLPPAQEASPASPTTLEDLFLESAPIESGKEDEPDVKEENLFSYAVPPSEEDQAPAISIEDAFGLGESPKTPSDEIFIPSPESVPITQNDPGATSMDLDKFLFDVTNEENAETILDIGGKGKQGASMTPEPSPLELESDSGVKMDDLSDLIFDDKSLAETKIKKPEQKPQIDFSPVSDSPKNLFSLSRKDAPEVSKQDESPSFTPFIGGMEDKTEVKPSSSFTTRRMENILPFNEEERENHGLRPAQKQDRNESLFQEQFQKGRKAFEQGDWKKAVYYLTVASAIKPDASDLKDMLTIARDKKRSEK